MSYTPNGLTAEDLLREIADDLDALFRESRFCAEGGELRKLHIFRQGIPICDGDDDDLSGNFPHIVVKIDSGEIANFDDGGKAEVIEVDLMLGIYDESPERRGALDLLRIIQRIKNHYGKCRRVHNYTVESPLVWAVDDQDNHPYYFGAVVLKFQAPRTIKEDPLT